MPDTKVFDVVIIGGGWAGLSTAIKLVELNKSVCIIEAAKQLGGRARTVQYKNHTVDNGTHIMVGAYTETLKLLRKIHSQYRESDFLERQNLNLNYKRIALPDISIPANGLPAPLNVVFSFLMSSGLTLSDKLAILKLGLKIKLNLNKPQSDLNIEDFLIQQQQPVTVIKNIWEPLCLAIMNTAINKTSTIVFLQVIKEAFFKSRQSSNVLLFKQDLSSTFSTPAAKYITAHHGKIIYQQAITGIQKQNNIFSINTRSYSMKAKNVVIATAPIAASKLLITLNTEQVLESLLNNLNQFSYQPICTVYLQYPEHVRPLRNMQGFIGSTAQWMFDKSASNQAGFISVIISSEGAHMDADNAELINLISGELGQFYPDWPPPIDAFVIREKRATFTASVNINRIRPSNTTNIEHLYLAGDYTNTLYPATLEGAVRSGLSCAEKILSEF